MKNELALLIETIQSATNRSELREQFAPRATRFFAAARGNLFFNEEIPPGIAANPIIQALNEGHAPLHEGTVLPPEQWQAICSRADHGHVLLGPLVRNGEIIGAAAFTRYRDAPEFDSQNLADLSALCLHISTHLLQIESPPGQVEALPFPLTPRENQIATLVAQGLTNDQIGKRLCVSGETVKAALKRMFRKTGATSRAQLVATLSPERSSSTNSLSSPKSRASAGG